MLEINEITFLELHISINGITCMCTSNWRHFNTQISDIDVKVKMLTIPSTVSYGDLTMLLTEQTIGCAFNDFSSITIAKTLLSGYVCMGLDWIL